MQINKPYCCYGRNVHNQKYFEKAVSVYSGPAEPGGLGGL